MKRFITLLLVSLSTILLIACSNQSSNSLDGEYRWINESRNEVAFTISGNKGNSNKGEADTFTIDKDSATIEPTGSNIINRKENYTFKDDVFTVDISGTKQEYYKKDSEEIQRQTIWYSLYNKNAFVLIPKVRFFLSNFLGSVHTRIAGIFLSRT